MKDSKLSNSFYWVLRIFVGVALALIVVAWLYPPATVRGPQGKPGATGATGKSGEQGEKGRTGATGARFWGGGK